MSTQAQASVARSFPTNSAMKDSGRTVVQELEDIAALQTDFLLEQRLRAVIETIQTKP